jgi:hypothetical protein
MSGQGVCITGSGVEISFGLAELERLNTDVVIVLLIPRHRGSVGCDRRPGGKVK